MLITDMLVVKKIERNIKKKSSTFQGFSTTELETETTKKTDNLFTI